MRPRGAVDPHRGVRLSLPTSGRPARRGAMPRPWSRSKHFLVRITDTGPLMDHLIGIEPRRAGGGDRPRRLAAVSAPCVALVLGFWAASAGSGEVDRPPGDPSSV